MDIEEEDFGCLGVPTEAQMWKQQADLVQAEYEEVSAELRRARANIAKLVEIHGVTALQRDQALHLLTSYQRDLSAALVELSEVKNKIRGLMMAQRASVEGPMPFTDSLSPSGHTV